MKKEILFEVNRLREIMGLNLLSEAPVGPGGPIGGISLLDAGKSTSVMSKFSDDLANVLKNSDEILYMKPESQLFKDYPVLKDVQTIIQDARVSLQRELLPSDTAVLTQIDNAIFDHYMDLKDNSFITSYIEQSPELAEFKNAGVIKNKFAEASTKGIKSLRGLGDELRQKVYDETSIPYPIRSYVQDEITKVEQQFTKKGSPAIDVALTRSYEDFIDDMATRQGVSAEDLKKAIDKRVVKRVKEMLVTNKGDVTKTVTQFKTQLDSTVEKIAKKNNMSKTDVIVESIENGDKILGKLLNATPYKEAWKSLQAGESLTSLKQASLITFYIIMASAILGYWKEGLEAVGLNKLSPEEIDVEKKFPNINKTNVFWKEVYSKMKSTGKVGELMRANASAIEEEVESKIFGENTYKVTFTWSGEYGTMTFFTDNEGENVAYGSGSGVFPVDKYDVPEETPLNSDSSSSSSSSSSQTALTDPDFRKWWSENTESDREIETLTISGNEATVKVKNSGTYLYKKNDDGTITYVKTI
jgi:hypothetical protein